jgi:hypothetical protein
MALLQNMIIIKCLYKAIGNIHHWTCDLLLIFDELGKECLDESIIFVHWIPS